MAAIDWLESIARLRARVDDLERAVESAYVQAGPKGQMGATVHGGGRTDPLTAIDAIVDTDATAELDRLRTLLHERMDYATDVLYGRSGRGGLALVTSYDDADVLCFHYLHGESWASIARRFEPDTSNLTTWCKRRAIALCRTIDRHGMEALADS